MLRIILRTSLLLVFISTSLLADEQPLRMPEYPDFTPPAPRAMSEVQALLAGKDETPATDEPLRVLLVAGPKDHQKGEHDYPAWQKVWPRLLAKAPNTEVKTAWLFPTPEEAKAADVMVFYQRGDWNEKRAELIDQFLSRGGGLVFIHWAVNGEQHAHDFAKRIGLASHAGKIGYRHGPIEIDFSPAADHPIARNFQQMKWIDETYWQLRGDASAITLLGTSEEEEKPRPQFWTIERDKSRVFVSIPGHYMWTFDDPAFRLLLMRGIAWTGRRNVDRFNNAILLDARVKE